MQAMSWTIARLGSRFSLLFEPHRNRVMHSALGRFLDRPLDLMVGLEEPDGTRRVLPFTVDGKCLSNAEQFERINSITFRAYSEKYNLRFEFNVHSVFYPQDERLCLMPAFYLEMRVNPVDRVRWHRPVGPTPQRVKLFIRLRQPAAQIEAKPEADGEPARIDMAYRNPLAPHLEGVGLHDRDEPSDEAPTVQVHERIVSLNPGCTLLEGEEGGLSCELPVTEAGSGIKWRLVWAAHVAEPVLQIKRLGQVRDARLRYTAHWPTLDDVIEEAITTRDERLAHSRRFEKLLEQAPLDVAEQHLLHQSFHAWLSNTFWCDLAGNEERALQWFSTWEGSCFYHAALDVEYNTSLAYLSLWPRLLGMQFDQWAEHTHPHDASGGRFLSHDLGRGHRVIGQAYPHHMEVEENANFLLLLQAYTHWTGDKKIAEQHKDLVRQLAQHLLWSDRDQSGFPSEGVANTLDDASPAVQFSRKQTYLALKRVLALRAAGGLLTMAQPKDHDQAGVPDAFASQCEDVAEADIQKIEKQAWLGDHYAVCIDSSTLGVYDAWSGQPLPFEKMPGWDAHSIYTGNGLLLPILIGQPFLLDSRRLRRDILNAMRENLTRYGCGHTSTEPENVWISQNLWRDILARYQGMTQTLSAQRYWDMQVMSNTHTQSLGYVDTYISNNLCFYPRGIVSIGLLLSGPRLIIDRLAAGGTYITVDPDRHFPQRWPLLPLADWKAGKIPVCVVDDEGKVTIEGTTDPVIVHGESPSNSETNSGAGLIG